MFNNFFYCSGTSPPSWSVQSPPLARFYPLLLSGSYPPPCLTKGGWGGINLTGTPPPCARKAGGRNNYV